MRFLPSKTEYPHQRLAVVNFVAKFRKTASLIDWAKNELELAGMFDEDSDYDWVLGSAILDMVELFSEQEHSGFSAGMATSILEKLLRYEPLTPVTNPTETGEYIEYAEDYGVPLFQSSRDSTIFSDDGGKSWYKLVDDIYEEPAEEGDGWAYYNKCRKVDLDDYNAGIGHGKDYRKHKNE